MLYAEQANYKLSDGQWCSLTIPLTIFPWETWITRIAVSTSCVSIAAGYSMKACRHPQPSCTMTK